MTTTHWITLHLATPHMTDKRVERMGGKPGRVTYAQHLLKKQGYDPGKADGEYGIHTAHAVKKAQDHLGYRKPNEVFGQSLLMFLEGAARPSVAMRIRAAARATARRRKAAATPKRLKAAKLTLDQVGTRENPPDSNEVKYSAWYGLVGPWCAMLVSWAGAFCGQRSFVRGERYAYCPYIIADAVAGRNGLSVTNAPVEGDVVVYTWGGAGSNPMGDHTGRFLKWLQAGYSFSAVEGNTSAEGDPSGSQSDGGGVYVRTRYTSEVVHFVRVAE